MKDKITRALPYVIIAADIVMLWANATNNDWITLDNLRTQLMYLTGHFMDIRFYDWIFDCLQWLPEKYSDHCMEEYSNHLAAQLYTHKWSLLLAGNLLALPVWMRSPDCILPIFLLKHDYSTSIPACAVIQQIAWTKCDTFVAGA